MKGLDSETPGSYQTEMPALWGEKLGHRSWAQKAYPRLVSVSSDASLKNNSPSLAGGTWLQLPLPAPRRLAPAPGPAKPEEEGLQMAGHLAVQEAVQAGSYLPPTSPCCASSSSPLRGREVGWGGGLQGIPVPSQVSGSHLDPRGYVRFASGPRVQHGPG